MGYSGGGVMAQWLRNSVIYPEVVGSIPSVDISQVHDHFHRSVQFYSPLKVPAETINNH